MWSLFNFKKKKTPNTSAPVQPAVSVAPRRVIPPPEPSAPVGISYDAKLISKLKGDHAELLTIFTRLLNAAKIGTLDAIPDDLMLFRRAFQSHVLLENVRFYVYMDRLLTDMPEERDYVKSLRKDMNGIAKAVGDFIHLWVATPPTPPTTPAFMEQLNEIGAALVSRVQLEESSLYTLYTERL